MALRAGRVGVRPDQVNAQGVILSGGGGGSTFKIDELLEDLAPVANTDYPLDGKISDYDFIYIVSRVTYTGSVQVISNMVLVDYIEIGDALLTNNEASSGGFRVKSDTVLTGLTATFSGATYKYSVYGIKF